MATASISGNIQVAGLNIPLTETRTDEGQIAQDPALLKAWAGTLTTRTDDDTGQITTTLTHDITASDYVVVFWDGGIAYYCDVTAVGGTTIDIDLCQGDNLPAQDTAVIVGKIITIDVDFDGDLVSLLAAYCESRAHLQFMDSGPAELHEQELTAGNTWYWLDNMGWANPLTGNPVDSIRAACANVSANANLAFGVLYDSVS